MKIYIYGLIVLFVYIFVNHFFNIKEGLDCFDTTTDISINKNNNTISEYKTTNFFDLVSKAEKAVNINDASMNDNMEKNGMVLTACCTDDPLPPNSKAATQSTAAGGQQDQETAAAKKEGTTGTVPSKAATKGI